MNLYYHLHNMQLVVIFFFSLANFAKCFPPTAIIFLTAVDANIFFNFRLLGWQERKYFIVCIYNLYDISSCWSFLAPSPFVVLWGACHFISLHRIVVPFGFCAFLKYLHAPFFPCSPHFFIFSQDFTSSLEAPVPKGQDLDPIFPAGKSPAASVSRLPAGL